MFLFLCWEINPINHWLMLSAISPSAFCPLLPRENFSVQWDLPVSFVFSQPAASVPLTWTPIWKPSLLAYLTTYFPYYSFFIFSPSGTSVCISLENYSFLNLKRWRPSGSGLELYSWFIPSFWAMTLGLLCSKCSVVTSPNCFFTSPGFLEDSMQLHKNNTHLYTTRTSQKPVFLNPNAVSSSYNLILL